jgi:hypothetical protein
MKVQGSTALWIMAIAIIGVFVITTVIAPGPVGSPNTNNNDGASSTTGSASDYYTPTAMPSTLGNMDEGDTANITLSASPQSGATGQIGWAWAFMIDADVSLAGEFELYYGSVPVSWYSAGSSGIVGLGQRITPGQGGTAVPATTSITLNIGVPGNFTLKAWIVKVEDNNNLNPSGLEARSGVLSMDLTVGDENTDELRPSITLNQTLSRTTPGAVFRNQNIDFTLRDSAVASGRWDDRISDVVIVERNGIGVGDVIGNVGLSRITWSDEGDRLVGTLRTADPFSGQADRETGSWTISIRLNFQAAGNYVVRAQAINADSDDVITSSNSLNIQVAGTGGSTLPSNATGTNNVPTNVTANATVSMPVSTSISTPTSPSNRAGTGNR